MFPPDHPIRGVCRLIVHASEAVVESDLYIRQYVIIVPYVARATDSVYCRVYLLLCPSL